MLCEFCKKAEVVEGTLEGISFEPVSGQKKWFAKGVYCIRATACPECGRLTDLSLDAKSLVKAMSNKK